MPKHRRPAARLLLRPLEDRLAPAVYTVAYNDDGPVTTPVASGNGYFTAENLRSAVVAADADGQADTIQFAPSLAGQTINLVASNTAATTVPGQTALLVTGNLTIDGSAGGGGAGVTISGANPTANTHQRVFGVNAGANLTLTNLSVSGGLAAGAAGTTGAGGAGLGGAVYNFGTLTLQADLFSGNAAVGGAGTPGGNGLGGAVYNDNGTLAVRDTTLAGNTAQGGGTTASGAGCGGAIYSRDGTVTLLSDTLSQNVVVNGDGSAGLGQGVYVLSDGSATPAVSVTNTIIGNTGASVSAAPDFVATSSAGVPAPAVTGTTDLIRVPGTGTPAGNLGAGIDPGLAPLGNYGGPTRTLGLSLNSPAVDAGTDAAVTGLATDQRGLPRITGAHTDIGAFEGRGFTVTATSGGGQTAAVGLPFTDPLVVTVGSNDGVPVTTGTVALSAPPANGTTPTALFPGQANNVQVAVTNGQVSVPVVAAGGSGSYTVNAGLGAGAAAAFSLTNTPATGGGITIAPPTLPALVVGNPFTDALAAAGGAGGPYTFSLAIGSLPAGLALASNGTISGTPTAAGTSNFSVRVADVNGTSVTAPFTLSVGTQTAPGGTTLALAFPAGAVYGRAIPANVTAFFAGGTPSGTIAVSVNGGTPVTAPLVAGLASFTLGALPVGTYPVAITYTPAAGTTFAAATATGTLIVAPAPLTVTAAPATKVYGAAVPALTDTVTGLAPGDTAAAVLTGTPGTTATAASPVGAYAVTAGTLAVTNGNYVLNFVGAPLTVTPAPLSVTANSVTQPAGSALPTFTGTFTGLVNGDTPASLSGVPSFSTTATAASPAGTYAITPSAGTLVVPNYVLTFQPGVLTLTGAGTGTGGTTTPGGAGGSRLASQYSTSPGAGGTVTVFGPTGTAVGTFTPFGGTTAAQTAAFDVNGDGVPDLIAVSGPGSPVTLEVIDGKSGQVILTEQPFESTFTGGGSVAVGDLEGDGAPDIAVGAGPGGTGRVVVYNGLTGAVLANFEAIDDPNFFGGVRVAIGDINGDGTADLVAAAGPGGGPRVAVWNGLTLRPGVTPARLVGDFYMFEPTFAGGVYVAAGDVNGDGRADIIASPGAGGTPRVRILSGQSLVDSNPTAVADFYAGDPTLTGGARVAVKDLDGDVYADLVVAIPQPVPATGTVQTTVKTYLGKNLINFAPAAAPPEYTEATTAGDIFVG